MSAINYKGYRIERAVFVKVYQPSDMFREPVNIADFSTIGQAKEWINKNFIKEE